MKSKNATSTLHQGNARPEKPPRPPKAKASPGADPCPRERAIAEAAYFRAEQRGFAPGNEMGDWLEAEAEIARSS